MSLAQEARWAKRVANAHAGKVKPKRTMSASARKKIAAFQRARWAEGESGKEGCLEPVPFCRRLSGLFANLDQLFDELHKVEFRVTSPQLKVCRCKVVPH